MTAPHQHWNVLPHGRLVQIDDGILTVVGRIHMPLMELPRCMTVVRLRDSRLVVWSAIALDEPAMAALEAFGRPAYLIVPNDHHRLDVKVWKDRYPRSTVVTPNGARAKVAEVVAVDSTVPDFGDDNVHFVTVPGTREHEAALVVRAPAGTTLVVNDLVGNIRSGSSIGNWLLRLTGFAGERPQIPRVVKWTLIKDADALRTQLLEWAEIDDLKRVIVSHGEPIESNPRQTLRELAASLQ